LKSALGITLLYDNHVELGAIIMTCILAGLFLYEMLARKSSFPVEEEEYRTAKEWLHFMGEKSRRTMPKWLLAITFVGVLIEAIAIIIVIISWFANTTRTVELYFGIGLGTAVAATIALTVHHAGEVLYREHHRRVMWSAIDHESNDNNDTDKRLIIRELKKINPSITFKKNGFVRTYGPVVWAVMMILMLSVFAFFSRANLNMGIINDRSASGEMQDAEFFSSPAAVTGDSLLEAKTRDSLLLAEAAGRQAVEQTEIKSMYAALLALLIIFLIINYMGGLSGYKYSFFCDTSEHSFKTVRKYERQQTRMLKKNEGIVEMRKIAEKKANQIFSIYYPLLTTAIAMEDMRDSMKQALNERSVYRMKAYIDNQQ